MANQQLITNNYRLHNAVQFINSINATPNSTYYCFAGQSLPFTGGSVPQMYDTTQQTQFLPYNQMLFGKNIKPSDMSLMINAYAWTSGTVYAQYDDQDVYLNQKQFFVYVNSGGIYYVWKCLYNNNGSASTYAPNYADSGAAPSSTLYQTSDGYRWKYMYQISAALVTKFATLSYIPVVVDANVTGNAVSGAIDTILITSPGAGYSNYYINTFSSSSVTNGTLPVAQLGTDASKVTNLYQGCYLYITGGTGKGQYKTVVSHTSNGVGTFVTLDSQYSITPDNTSTYEIMPKVVVLGAGDATTNAAARAVVNTTSNSIYKVEVLNRGINVLYANAYVYASPYVGVSNSAVIRVVSGPKGGHGSNVAAELFSNSVGVSVTFANTESSTIPAINQYQSIGILKNPLFANVTLQTNVSTQTGTFKVGESIQQVYGNTTTTAVVSSVQSGYLLVTNVAGIPVVTSNSSTTITGLTSGAVAQTYNILVSGQAKGFSTFTQFYQYQGSTLNGTSFTQNETVYQQNIATANGICFGNSASGANVFVTSKYGPITSSNTLTGASSGAIFNISSVQYPDLVAESGDILLMENFNAISRSSTQSETVHLILQF